MNIKLLGIATLLVLLCGFMTFMTAEPWFDLSKSTFLQPNNVENLLRRTSMYGILGIGVAFVIISGGIDLSIGSVVCLAGCLLAIFLHVDYRPFDELPILRADAARRAFIVEGEIKVFSTGDRIRYSGGRRARSGLFTVTGAEQADLPAGELAGDTGSQLRGADSTRVTVISVEEPIGNDDRTGQLARAVDVLGVTVASPRAGAASLELAGDHPGIAARDQLALVHPQTGLNQVVVESATAGSGRTVVTLDRDLDRNVTADWSAIPLERRQRLPVLGALAAVTLIALLLGYLHGLLVTRVRLQSFVVTLCGLLIYRGVSRWLVSDQPIGFGSEYESTLSRLGTGKLELFEWQVGDRVTTFGLPYPFFILIAVALLASLFLNKTIWGRYLLALGRNEEAARYSGINTARVILIAYVVCTVLAAVGGILFALDSNSISPSSFGNFFELYAIAAAVLGGCSLRGGEGSVLGVLIGTAVMQILYNLIILMKISANTVTKKCGMTETATRICRRLFLARPFRCLCHEANSFSALGNKSSTWNAISSRATGK